MKKIKALYPEFVEEFKCIADNCKNSCCIGWQIPLDKDTLKKYKNSNHPLFKNKHKELFSKINSRNYIKLNAESKCNFLNSERLCSIHSQLGEQYLCNTCKTYPRMYRSIDGQHEVGLTISCEAAAKIILDNPEGITFNKDTIEYPKNFYHTHITDTKNLIQRNFWPIRVFIIEILQFRGLSIEERLAVISIFLEDIKKANVDDEIIKIINIYTENIESNKYKGFLDNLENKDSLLINQINITNRLISKYSSNNKDTNILNKLSFSNGFSTEDYVSTYNSKYKPFIQEYDYILENYLVNAFYNQSAMFTSAADLWAIFTGIVARIGVIKKIITYHLSINEKMIIDELILDIAECSRILDHNKNLNIQIVSFLHELGLDSAPNLISISSI